MVRHSNYLVESEIGTRKVARILGETNRVSAIAGQAFGGRAKKGVLTREEGIEKKTIEKEENKWKEACIIFSRRLLLRVSYSNA